MKILHKYLIKEIFSVFSLTLFSITFIFMVKYIFYILSYLSEANIEGYLIYNYFICLIPELLVMTIPMSVLVSVLIALGRLSSDNEIMAIYCSGISLVKLTYPLLILSLILSFLVYSFCNNYLPKIRLYRRAIEQILLFKVATNIPEKKFLSLGDNFYMYVGKHRGNKYEKITLLKKVPQKNESIIIIAKYGEIKADFDNFILNMNLFNGAIHHKADTETDEGYQYVTFDNLIISKFIAIKRMENGIYHKRAKEKSNAELRKDIKNMEKKILKEVVGKENNVSYEEFITKIQSLRTKNKVLYKKIKKAFIEHNNLVKELAQRYYAPFTSFIFCLIAIGLGIKLSPRTKAWGFIISIILFFFYYLISETCESFIEKGVSHPFVISWIPNIIFGTVGLYLFYQLGKK